MIKVKMMPHLSDLGGESGINRVIEAYFKHLPAFDIELVSPDATDFDLIAAHAGITGGECSIAHTHGLYWTADYAANEWEWHVNSRVIEACRNAKYITVPSAWVAESFRRDMRLDPFVIPHGIDWQDWQHKESSGGYVLWNKNRAGIDICDNSILDVLMNRFPKVPFVSTFTTPSLNGIPHTQWPANFKILENGGKTPHATMKRFVQRAGIYLSVAKETFGIGVLEAMASGVPVLGWAWGGNTQLVQHGINGYLAKPNDTDDLCEGLNFCLKYHKTLGANGRELSKNWTWQKACEMVAGIYRLALQDEPATVSVVIPVYNKLVEQIERAIDSVIKQTYQPKSIVIVDDGSDNEAAIRGIVEAYKSRMNLLHYIRQQNNGVAIARNRGIDYANDSTYITCLDADDWLEPSFLEVCVKTLESDKSLGIVYTGLMAHNADGSHSISPWPGQFNPDKQLSYPKMNQVPTCCVFRRDAWQRVGGYKARYAPLGAGSEDAALWSAICSIGYNALQVTKEPLFNYSMQGGFVHDNPEYSEVDWLSMQPWAKDGQHHFASVATPKRWSHPVRQYDMPDISVIIPVGPGHEKEVANALDSLEMQHFRKWEAIVVWDSDKRGSDSDEGNLLKSYPYIRMTHASHHWPSGAGVARNQGVNMARAPLIFFLDADDVLVDPHAFDKMLQAWNSEEAIIYSDYLGKAQWDYEAALKEFGDDLLSYNKRLGTAVFSKKSANYDPNLAQRQPEASNTSAMPYYHWCLVSILIPKVWHDAIGGFDEAMETWEDVDYMWRLARAGYCFHHVTEPLVMYSYHKGSRREKSAVNDADSLQKHKNLIQYIKRKYEELEVVACNCGKKRQQQAQISGTQAVNNMNDNELVMIQFDFMGSDKRTNYGKPLISPTGQINPVTHQKYNYNGYARRAGDKFLVHVKDQRARPDMFKIVNEIKLPEQPKMELKEPELLVQTTRRRGRQKVVA